MTQQTRLAVLGAGGWGTAVAIVLSRNPLLHITLWSPRSDHGLELERDRENRRLLPGVKIPAEVHLTCDPAATADAEGWVSVIPTIYLRSTMMRLPGYYRQQPVISLTKGLEIGTFKRPSQIIGEVLGTHQLLALSGPNHAEEVARGMPTSAVIAGNESSLTTWGQKLFTNDRFRVYTNQDIVGVELAGALKNILGIAAGISDGLGFGDNAKSALLTRGLVEMARFAGALGAEHETFYGLAGMGDLITTCFSPHGRNRMVGERLARGESLADILASVPSTPEGVSTAKSVYERCQKMEIDMPICTGVYRVLYDGIAPLDYINQLMMRKPAQE
ncbi:MAG: NAD(P)H-dependent glycerol-3-phosphate dehydrogenase [Zavarzinella sp.]